MKNPMPKYSKKTVGSTNLQHEQEVSTLSLNCWPEFALQVNLQSLSSENEGYQEQSTHKPLQEETGDPHNVIKNNKPILWPCIPTITVRKTGEVPLKEVISTGKVG